MAYLSPKEAARKSLESEYIEEFKEDMEKNGLEEAIINLAKALATEVLRVEELENKINSAKDLLD